MLRLVLFAVGVTAGEVCVCGIKKLQCVTKISFENISEIIIRSLITPFDTKLTK